MSRQKLTINEFKRAIRLDGNLEWSNCKLIYVTSQIDCARTDGQITQNQADKLYDWAHDKYAD